MDTGELTGRNRVRSGASRVHHQYTTHGRGRRSFMQCWSRFHRCLRHSRHPSSLARVNSTEHNRTPTGERQDRLLGDSGAEHIPTTQEPHSKIVHASICWFADVTQPPSWWPTVALRRFRLTWKERWNSLPRLPCTTGSAQYIFSKTIAPHYIESFIFIIITDKCLFPVSKIKINHCDTTHPQCSVRHTKKKELLVFCLASS